VQVFAGFTFKATGGVPPFRWSASSLPLGLSVDASNGEILGTPTQDGIYSKVGVTVTDSGSSALQASETLSITIFAPPLSITPGSPPDGVIGTVYSTTLATSRGTNPVTWSVSAGTLPGGLILSASAGTITGTPTTEGFFNFTVQAADSSTPQLTRTQALTITVNPTAVNNAELNGQYAFSFRGFETFGPDGIVGSFTADGEGNLTNGFKDVNQVRGGAASQAFVGTYEIFADNRGIFKLMTSPGGADLGTFRFAVGSINAGVASMGRFASFDPIVQNSPMEGAGVFEKQDPTAF
jgi:Putative Ig domain